jgi:hypothetical protein
VDLKRIGELADTQHGLISAHQANALGATEHQIRQQEVRGVWERVHLGVYRVRGAAPGYRQALVAACLAIGPEVTASHRAAATVHGLLSYADPPVEVTTTRLRSPEVRGVVVHRLKDLHPRWVTCLHSVRTTTVARTLVDLGAVASSRTVEAALDRAAGRKLVTYREVRDAMRAVARQGRRGVGTIRRLLEARVGEALPAGVFEATMTSLLRVAGLPRASPEYLVTDDHGGFIAVVDFAYPDRRLAIEVDGYEFHSSPRALADRNQRDRLLLDAGWRTLHYSWAEVEHRPTDVGADVRRKYWAR